MMDEKKICKNLSSLIGNENVSGNIYERIISGQDASQPDLEPEKIPAVVVKPPTTEAVSKVINYANVNKIPVYIHGAGTAFKGSTRPKKSGSILLSTRSLNTIDAHEEDIYYEIGAGVNQYEFEKVLMSRGYILPMCIGSKYASTMGGAVSINTIGHMVDICLGKIIDYVMGLEVVLPNGDIIDTGTKSIRRPAGIDYTRFFAGTEGVFGVITKIRLRVIPNLKKAYILGFFPELTDIAHVFQRYYREKLPPPLYGEFIDKVAARAPFSLRGLPDPKGHIGLAINVAHTQEEADRQAREMVRVFKAEKAIDAFIVTSEQEKVDYWEARDNILNVFHVPDGGKQLVMAGGAEFVVPLGRLDDAIEYMQKGHRYDALKKAGLFVYGHVGTCDLHGIWTATEEMPDEERKSIAAQAMKLEGDINMKWGCASGEVGQTAARIPFLKKRYGFSAYNMLMDMKKAIDPNNILNPGNLEGEGYE